MEDRTVGYYNLFQLTSQRDTEKRKEHMGIFPWSRMTLLRMVKDGKFPAPAIKIAGQNMWRKNDVHEFIKKLEAMAESI